MQLRTSVYNGFFAVHAIYTTTTTKPFTGLYSGVSANLPCFVAVVWRVHPAMLHRLRHVGAHTVKRSTSNDTKHHRHTGRCTGQGNRPIIIRYIRVQVCALLWVYARQCSRSQTVQARRGQSISCADCWQVLTYCQQYRPCAPAEGSASPPVQGQPGGLRSGTGQQSGRTLHPAGQSSSRSAAGGAEPLAATAAALFRAFAR